MAQVTTTLVGAQGASDQTVTLTSATGIAVGSLVRVDAEWELVTDISASPTLKVVRGFNNGSTSSFATAHVAGAAVVYGLPTDFPQGYATTQLAPVMSYVAAGAIAVPVVDATVYLNGASTNAYTLAAPTDDQTNRVLIQAIGAHAYTVTNTTPGFNNGSSSDDVATFGGAVGDNMLIQAFQGVWNVINLTNVTLG